MQHGFSRESAPIIGNTERPCPAQACRGFLHVYLKKLASSPYLASANSYKKDSVWSTAGTRLVAVDVEKSFIDFELA